MDLNIVNLKTIDGFDRCVNISDFNTDVMLSTDNIVHVNVKGCNDTILEPYIPEFDLILEFYFEDKAEVKFESDFSFKVYLLEPDTDIFELVLDFFRFFRSIVSSYESADEFADSDENLYMSNPASFFDDDYDILDDFEN